MKEKEKYFSISTEVSLRRFLVLLCCSEIVVSLSAGDILFHSLVAETADELKLSK